MAKEKDRKAFSTRLDPELIKRVKRWAIERDMSLQEVTALAFKNLLSARDGPK